MNNFYVYMYSDTGDTSFYIGKGCGQRYKVLKHLHRNTTNKFLKKKILKIGIDNVQIKFLHKDLTEDVAIQFEIFYIGLYGRRDLGLGTLCNLSDGGEGSSGYIFSEESKRKMSLAKVGKVLSAEAKHNMSKAHTGHIGVIHTEDTKRKISIAKLGHKQPEDAVRKVAEINKGNTYHLGHKHSEEARRKMREAHARRLQKVT